MKPKVVESFLLGMTFGVGITFLSLYTQKPGLLAASLETMAELGRARKVKEEERRLRRERLRAVGFSDEEIEEIL